jgi:hypothetical protein
MVKSLMLLMDRHGGQGRLAMTLRNYSTGFRINPLEADNRYVTRRASMISRCFKINSNFSLKECGRLRPGRTAAGLGPRSVKTSIAP